MTPKLWLIGMISSGKTKVGRRLSDHSGLPFVDVDDEIVERAGMTIPQILANHGEPAFRAMESEEVARIARSRQRLVVATGGGAILDGTSRRLMRETGLVVWLKPPIASLIAKGKTHNRPSCRAMPTWERVTPRSGRPANTCTRKPPTSPFQWTERPGNW